MSGPLVPEHHDHVELLAGIRSDGTPAFEIVPAEPLGDDRWRLLASTAILEGVAAGDVIRRDAGGGYDIVERGGNIAVQVWYPDHELHGVVDLELTPRVEALGGWFDARGPHATGYTFPLSTGFEAIERLLESWTGRTDGALWAYANVYAEDGETPLGWWEQQ
jgi:hypothetical protein